MSCLVYRLFTSFRSAFSIFFGCELFLAALTASAAIVSRDNFDAQSPGWILNCTSFTHQGVSAGNFDIIVHLGFGIGYASGFGSCFDMDSATDQVDKLTNSPLIATGFYILSFDVSGNLRRDRQDAPTALFGDLTVTITLSAGEPYQTITRNMTIGAGDANIVFARGSIVHDRLGIILGNVLVETSRTV